MLAIFDSSREILEKIKPGDVFVSIHAHADQKSLLVANLYVRQDGQINDTNRVSVTRENWSTGARFGVVSATRPKMDSSSYSGLSAEEREIVVQYVRQLHQQVHKWMTAYRGARARH